MVTRRLNLKVKVVKCLGEKSYKHFGFEGDVLEVREGYLIDKTGYRWTNDGRPFTSFLTLYAYFFWMDDFAVKFEVIED